MDHLIEPLWKHQEEAIAKAGNRYALFFDPGVGKSRTAIELIKKHTKGPEKIIIFAPLNVCRNWIKEINKYWEYDSQVYLVAGQTKAKKLDTIREFAIGCQLLEHRFLICNIECLRGKEYRDLLSRSGASFIIIDESHNFKSPTSLQTKGLLEVERNLKPTNLYLLSGTPAPQGEIDLWSTFALLKKTNDIFFIWRKKHFIDKNERRRGTANYWPEYVISPQSKILFQKILAECSMTAKKDEVLDLPPLLRTSVYAEMSKEQARHYETMREYLFAIDEDGNELNAGNLLVRTLRLQQILAGFIGNVPMKDNPRLQALDAAIEKTNGEQFIVWTIFAATYDQLASRIDAQGPERDMTIGFLTGDQSAELRHETIERFQKGELRALIAHPKAGGVGVNLTAASYSIHYTRSYSLVDDLQCEARNYRGGSERHKRITRIDIITPDTIDEEITEALREKKQVQDFILGLKQKHFNKQLFREDSKEIMKELYRLGQN